MRGVPANLEDSGCAHGASPRGSSIVRAGKIRRNRRSGRKVKVQRISDPLTRSGMMVNNVHGGKHRGNDKQTGKKRGKWRSGKECWRADQNCEVNRSSLRAVST